MSRLVLLLSGIASVVAIPTTLSGGEPLKATKLPDIDQTVYIQNAPVYKPLKAVNLLDINQRVYIQNAPVLGDGAGEAALNVCTNFQAEHVKNLDGPNVKVCGTGIKVTIFLMGDPPAHHEGSGCNNYYDFQWTVGKCDSSMPSTTCETMGPAQDKRIGAAQSYIVEQCP